LAIKKEALISENLLMNSFKNETFEEWASWKLPYIQPPRVKISSRAGFVNLFYFFFLGAESVS
jgi:hypothetical protein